MKRCVASLLALSAIVAASVASARPSLVAEGLTSPLVLARLSNEDQPRLRLAQRSIEREWPTPQDSGATSLPGGRSPLGALAFSAVAPGAGQLYAGRMTGLYFAAAEVASWIGWLTFRHQADDLRDEARGVAGTPDDSSSAWSFARYEGATQQDASRLRALYAADRDAFDEAIGGDSRYAAGWSAPEARAEFSDLRGRSDRRLSQSRATEGVIWVNHVVAALDALRSAQMRNRSLGHGLELKANGGWRRGGPDVVLALQRRF